MKKVILLLTSLVVNINVFSQVSIDTTQTKTKDTLVVEEEMFQLTNGEYITKSQLDVIFEKAWDNSFGTMTEEEKKILFGDNTKYIIITKEE